MRDVVLSAVLLLVFSVAVPIGAKFNFVGQGSRLRITDPSAKLILNSPINNFQGTLVVTDSVRDQVVGAPINFSSGIVEKNGASAAWTGVFDPSNDGLVVLQGASLLRAQPGTLFNGLHVSGPGNLVEGTPKFSSPIVLANSDAELKLSIQNKLNHDVYMNGGTLTLEDTLSIGDNVSLFGDGTININSHTLNLPGKDSVWTSALQFLSATDVTLNAVTSLSSVWYFGPSNSTAVLQGNGNVLDLSSGGSLAIQNGVGLGVTDIVIKGLSAVQGTIVMWDQNSTLSLSNAVLQFSGPYTFTQGNLYFYGANSMIVTGSNVVTIGGSCKATIDATTVEYDTLSFIDSHPIVPIIPDTVHLVTLNSGRLMSRPAGTVQGGSLSVTVPYYKQFRHESIDGINRKLSFAGSGSVSAMIWDGNGYMMDLPLLAAQSGSIVVAANKAVTLQNIVVRNFSTSAITLGTGASLVFGDGVILELAAYEALAMTLSFVGQFIPSTIQGNGKCLDVGQLPGNNKVAIYVGQQAGLTIEDAHIIGLQGGVNYDTSTQAPGDYTYSTNAAYIASHNLIRCADYTGILNFRNTDINLAGNYTLTSGSINIYNDVNIRGNGHTFAFSSNGTLAIQSASTLMIDRGVTFSYDSSGFGDCGGGPSKEQLTMADQSSRLFLNGCTFYGTKTSPSLKAGVLLVNDLVRFESEGSVDAEAITLNSTGNLRVEVLAGATMDVYGAMAHQ